MTSNYLLFMLVDRVFGTPLSGAKEIFAWRRPHPVPRAYSYVEGVIDYRGMVFPVFNLEQQLGLKRAPGAAVRTAAAVSAPSQALRPRHSPPVAPR